MTLKQKLEEYTLVMGEKREGMNYTARTYFFYASSTGIEKGINQCPFARIMWTRGGETLANGTRITEMCIAISQPIFLKMVCMHTSFGNPMNRKYLYLELDPTAERMHITGLAGFGEFTGRAKINVDKSGLDMKTIKENFTIQIIAAPIVGVNTETRSLLY